MPTNVRGEEFVLAVPIGQDDLIQRTDTALRDQKQQRLLFDRGQWLLVDVSKAKPITLPNIEQIARKLGAIAVWEKVVGLS